MKLKDKLTIAREIAAVSLEGFGYLSVSEILDADGHDAELLTDDIHELITNAIAAEVRGTNLTKTETPDLFDLASIGIEVAEPTPAGKRTSALVYGRHRVGKSSLVAQCAEVEGMYPILWIATEDGTGAFAGQYPEGRIDVVHAKDTATVIQVVNGLVDNETKYKTVVLDTGGQFQEIIKRDYQKANPNAKNAFEVWDKVAGGLYYVTDALHNSQYNFFLIAHTAKEKDDVLGTVLLSPHFLGKKSLVEIPKIPDTIMYLEKTEDEEGSPIRLLHLTASGRIDAGSRYEHKLPDHMVDPKMEDYYKYITA